ncbi:metal-dependent hydrolase [Halorientalis brevis]|uniref:Metal-dependent hydrolase n=1 Tax=Halorientalis brevis TaxID=1126241 RepID=A0ABD6CDU3_9EURY|nr:metal-dependent hydrolase [Halorientalis brevis]
MVDIMGHVAMGLLWALPAWFIWKKRVALAFVGVVVPTALLPDVDLWLHRLFPAMVHHHGVTHTVVFVAGLSVVFGGIVAALFTDPIDRWLQSERFTSGKLFGFALVAFLLGGLSHLFADMLSAPDIATPIEPFWPFFDKPWAVDVIWYNSPVWNAGLLAVAVLLHVVVATVTDPTDHSYRLTDV